VRRRFRLLRAWQGLSGEELERRAGELGNRLLHGACVRAVGHEDRQRKMSADGAVGWQRDEADIVDHHVGRSGLVRDDRVRRQQGFQPSRSRFRARHQIEQEIRVLRRQQIAQLQPAEQPRHVVRCRRIARVAGVARARLAQRLRGHF